MDNAPKDRLFKAPCPFCGRNGDVDVGHYVEEDNDGELRAVAYAFVACSVCDESRPASGMDRG